MSESVRVAVLSRRLAERRVWQASQYEFEDVIAAVDDVKIIAPVVSSGGGLQTLVHNAANRLGRRFGRPRRARMLAPGEVVDAELFFAVFAAPSEINTLPLVKEQLARSRRKVAFIVEMYEPQVEGARDYLLQLRGFDHIFVFTRAVIPAIERITGVPCTFLATGVDADIFSPPEAAPERFIDVMSYGRRLKETHEGLLEARSSRGLHYFYDTVRGVFDVSDHRDHRTALASALQRSRYAIVYKNNDEPARISKTGGEETLTNRFFEATAAGAVVLGSAPDVADFDEMFDWPDSLIPIPAPAPGIVDEIEKLDRQPERLRAASRAGILAGLRRHDWGYRWRHILGTLEMPEDARLVARLDRLQARAARLESSITMSAPDPKDAPHIGDEPTGQSRG